MLHDINAVKKTANALNGLATHFRCKVVGGGTSKEKYQEGIGITKGVKLLEIINKQIPAGTEVHTLSHIEECKNLSFIWVGARNSQNYTLLEHLKCFEGDVFIKRGVGMTVKEMIGIFDIMAFIHKKPVYMVERGIVNINEKEQSRWSISINDLLYIKYNREDIFRRLIVDCSHSSGRWEYIYDIYRITKYIGCNHHMIECTYDGISKTDQEQMLSVNEVKTIIEKNQ
jgi:3-deoxy-D-arabino-heptulosonate 7-phosphate (DAHP) synthase